MIEMSSTPSESEQYVEEAYSMMTVINELLGEFNENKAQDEKLIQQSREALLRTQHFIDQNKSLIPAYSLKKVSDSMKLLEGHLNTEAKTKLQFSFRTRLKESPKGHEKTTTPLVTSEQKSALKDVDKFKGFRDRVAETLVLELNQSEAGDVSLENLSECKVKIIGNVNTVYINNLTNTSVTVCLARRAITVIKCTSCQFTLICQQLRIDSANKCNFTIYTSARSMLETSSELSFKPLKLEELVDCDTESINRLMADNNFKWSDNNWKCVDDFDWLVPNIPSKNYKLLES